MMDSRPKVMVVDDNPGMRQTLEGIIEAEGFKVVAALDGYQAIRLARDAHYPLIFMDMVMPGINGVDTYREIKKIRPGSVVQMMTGFSVATLEADALEEGAYGVIYKPFDMAQIIEIARTVLNPAVVLVDESRNSGAITMADEVSISIATEADVVTARQRGRALAAEIGLPSGAQTLVATAISEVARNILQYAERGQIRLWVGQREDMRGITVVAQDQGPGIPDISQALQDGYSTRGRLGLGLGLPGARRLMDEFEILSEVGKGTIITMTKWGK